MMLSAKVILENAVFVLPPLAAVTFDLQQGHTCTQTSLVFGQHLLVKTWSYLAQLHSFHSFVQVFQGSVMFVLAAH